MTKFDPRRVYRRADGALVRLLDQPALARCGCSPDRERHKMLRVTKTAQRQSSPYWQMR
jgi:hypothetical protein